MASEEEIVKHESKTAETHKGPSSADRGTPFWWVLLKQSSIGKTIGSS